MRPTESPIDVHRSKHTTRSDGPNCGRTSVFIHLGPKLDINYTVGSLFREMDNNGWSQRLNHGETTLTFTGTERPGTSGRPGDALYSRHSKGILGVCSKFPHVHTTVETLGQKIPQEEIEPHIDHYLVYTDTGRLEGWLDGRCEESVPYFVKKANVHDTADFIIETEKKSSEGTIQEFVEEFGVSRNHIWLKPAGEDIEAVRESYPDCLLLAKRNNWSVSPRLDLFEPTDG